MNRKMKRVSLMLFDTLAIILASTFSYLFLGPYISLNQRLFALLTFLFVMIYIGISYKMRIFDKINRYTSIRETLTHCVVITGTFLFTALLSLVIYQELSFRYLFLTYAISIVLIAGSRVVWRILIEHQKKLEIIENEPDNEVWRTLIVGAGEGGSLFIKNLQMNPAIQFIGLIDDDSNKSKTTLFGIPVLGKIDEIEQIVSDYDIDQITIAIPSLTTDELERIVSITTKTDAVVNQMPAVEDIVAGKFEVNKFKEIDVTDLLGREEVKLDMEQIARQLAGKTILISGAGGSIGAEISRQVVRFSPKRVILLGHGEYSIYLINKELNQVPNKDFELVSVIADIQDRERIFKVMEGYKPDRVYHAAAHKHVPMMEHNPREAVKNNIFGTKNMAEAAKAVNVKSFVMVSTDKAVNPPNVMGATKRVAEMIVTGLNEKGKTNFVAVRFGNVLNSRGSVIPAFKEQIKNGGPITVTDFRMTRYFMTIPEASRLVLQASSLAKGGEIFVLDMGDPVKIVDLAKKMVRLSGYTETEIPIVEGGIRPGEKLFEELLTNEEQVEEQVFDKIFVGNVENYSYQQVVEFINHIENFETNELREVLVDFANAKIELNDETRTESEAKTKLKLIYS